MALDFWKIFRGLSLKPQTTTPTSLANGDLYYDNSTNKFIGRVNGASDNFVFEAASATLTNKTISGASNTLTNIADTSLSVSYLKADGTRALTGNWNAGSFSGTFNGAVIGSAANTISAINTLTNIADMTVGPSSANALNLSTNSVTKMSISSAGTIDTSNGQVRIVSATTVGTALLHIGSAVETIRTSATQRALRIDDTYNSSSTSDYSSILVNARSDATSFTNAIQSGIQFVNRTKGAGSTITRMQHIYFNAPPSQGTNNASISDNVTYTGNWFINSTDTNPSLFSGAQEWKQQATPSNPASGNNRVYFKSDGNLYKLDSAGVETAFGVAGTGYVNGGNAFGGNATLGLSDNFSLSLITNATTKVTINNIGQMGIGDGTISASRILSIRPSATNYGTITGGATSGSGINLLLNAPVGMTVANQGMILRTNTDAASFTCALLEPILIVQDAAGAGSTQTNYNGIRFSRNAASATNNTFISDTQAPTGTWFIYNGTITDPSYYLGPIRTGSASAAIGAGQEQFTSDYSLASSATNANAGAFRLTLTGNTAQSATARGIRAQYARTITTSTTDTGANNVLDLVATAFTVSAAQVLTNSSSAGVSYIAIANPTVTGGGTLAITNMYGIKINDNSLSSGTNKANVAIGAATGATNNTVLLLGTNTIPTGTFELYSSGTGASLFAGSVQFADGTASVPGLAFSSDADGSGTGLYRVAANQMGFSTNGTLRGSVDSAGKWILGASGGGQSHVVNGRSIEIQHNSNSGAYVLVQNSSNTSAADALVELTVAGTSSGDAYIRFDATGNDTWALGPDSSDSGSFKISENHHVGTNDCFKIVAGGGVSFGPLLEFALSANGRSLTFSRNPGAGNPMNFTIENTSNTDPGEHSFITLKVGGSTAGDPYIRYQSPTDWSAGVDNSDSDSWKVCENASLDTTNSYIRLATGGVVTIGKTSATSAHVINGTISYATYQKATDPSTGATITTTTGVPGLRIAGSGTIATQTIKLPPSPVDGQIFWVASSKTITAVTWQDSGGTAANVFGGKASIGAAGGQTFMYDSAGGIWMATSG